MGADFPTSGDGLQDKGRATIPMAEFWTPGPGQDDGPNHMADMKEAASAAHIYGKPIVAAESFTTMPPPLVPAFSQSPFYLKRLADRALAHGINRFVIHTSVHQPFVDEAHKPGMTLGFFGQHYSRNNTWAEQAVAWNTYLARASHLLQQGRFVADLAYFYGEGAPNAVPYWKPVNPALPGRLRLRLGERRGAARSHDGARRAARAAERHELSRARASRRRDAADAADGAQASRARRRRARS